MALLKQCCVVLFGVVSADIFKKYSVLDLLECYLTDLKSLSY